MLEVNLARPSFVKDVLRYPVENPITVSREDYERLKASNSLADDEDGDDLSGLKVADLQKIATDEGVDLKDATKKDAIIDAIRAHRAAKSAEQE